MHIAAAEPLPGDSSAACRSSAAAIPAAAGIATEGRVARCCAVVAYHFGQLALHVDILASLHATMHPTTPPCPPAATAVLVVSPCAPRQTRGECLRRAASAESWRCAARETFSTKTNPKAQGTHAQFEWPFPRSLYSMMANRSRVPRAVCLATMSAVVLVLVRAQGEPPPCPLAIPFYMGACACTHASSGVAFRATRKRLAGGGIRGLGHRGGRKRLAGGGIRGFGACAHRGGRARTRARTPLRK